MKRKVTFFAVAITVLLLIALTMNSVSAESKAKVKPGPFDTAKENLNHTDVAKEELNHTNVAKWKLNHTDADRVKLNHTDAAKEKLNPSDAEKVNLNFSDAANVELNPSEPMTFPTERALNELIYDDGTAEGANAWTSAGNGRAVRFTPLSYPVDLLTARICFWHHDWPDSNHEEFAVYVYDDDGPSGEPGTCLGGPIYHTATAWGWCDVDISGLGITIKNGDFYILYKQLTDYPDCEGLCVDRSLPQYGRSWDYYDGSWDWDVENYMIRCVVDDSSAKAKWTFMVYLDGDNNVETYAIGDFLDMSSVGSTSDVNIVVQFDRIEGYDDLYDDWKTCKRFFVTKWMTPTAANATMDLDECNMGDPNTLSDFVDWAMTQYPADNYALILWNHGNGWKGKGWVPWNDDTGIARGVCEDWTDGFDDLSLQNLEQALAGKPISLIGYMACLMHMIEVVYQVGNAGISVGSEESIWEPAWPFVTILSDLTGTPTMTSRTLGETIVSDFRGHNTWAESTLSAADVGDVSGLVTAVDNLAQVLLTKIPGNYDKIQQARNEAEVFYYDAVHKQYQYIDLYHFAELIGSYVPGTSTAAQAVMNNINNAVYAESHRSAHPDAHGLTIYFPETEAAYLTSYENTKFATATNWDEFLKKYYNPGERGDDYGVFRNGIWCVDTTGNHIADLAFGYGIPGDVPLVGDINQDGTDDIAIFRNGMWCVDTTGNHIADLVFGYGIAGDVPLVGDIDQDGTDDIAIFRNGIWCVDTTGNRIADLVFGYGIAGDVPLVGDIDQDGTDDTAIFRNGIWCVDTTGNHIADLVFGYGIPGDIPLVGDIDQDGTDDTAIFRNGIWCVDTTGNHIADLVFGYGIPGDVPLVGNIG